MNFPELRVLSFIVKIWEEDIEDETGRTLWRGSITHVPSGDRHLIKDLHYIKDLDDIRAFIVPYMEKMGFKFRKLWSVCRWLRQLKR